MSGPVPYDGYRRLKEHARKLRYLLIEVEKERDDLREALYFACEERDGLRCGLVEAVGMLTPSPVKRSPYQRLRRLAGMDGET